MTSRADTEFAEPVGQLSLWFGILGGAAAWGAHLAISYALVPLACAVGLEILLYMTIPATLMIAAAAILFSWRGWKRAQFPKDDIDNGHRIVIDRVRFMALSGLVMSGFFLVVIIAQSVPIIMQSPCDPAGSIRI
jgi:nitrogen fixation-related uncharacterized protein